MQHLLLFHSNNGFVNATQCYVMPTLFIFLFSVIYCETRTKLLYTTQKSVSLTKALRWMTQALSCVRLTTATWVQALPVAVGIVVDTHSARDKVSSPSNSGFPFQRHSTNTPYSTFIFIFKGGINKSPGNLRISATCRVSVRDSQIVTHLTTLRQP